MKFLFFLLALISSIACWSQKPEALVSMTGIGHIRVGMKKADVEKITGQRVKLVNLLRGADDWDRDTVRLNYKGIDYELIFDRGYDEDSKDFLVYEVRSFSPGLRTISGVAIGDDKIKIVTTYEDYMIQLVPAYEGKGFAVKSKTKSTAWLFGDSTTMVIIFYLTNNKVTGFSVTYNEGC